MNFKERLIIYLFLAFMSLAIPLICIVPSSDYSRLPSALYEQEEATQGEAKFILRMNPNDQSAKDYLERTVSR